jgi:O-antigen ligase
MANVMVSTGSRGPILALGGGLMALTLGKGSLWARSRNGIIIALGVGALVWLSLGSEVTRHRFEKSLKEGNMAHREQVFPAAWHMFLDRPFLGWGPVNKNFEITRRVPELARESLGSHNSILELLTGMGLLGAIPFLIGSGLCVRAAWRARNGSHGILPFTLLMTAVLHGMEVDGLNWKTLWLALAYGLARGNALILLDSRRGRRGMRTGQAQLAARRSSGRVR